MGESHNRPTPIGGRRPALWAALRLASIVVALLAGLLARALTGNALAVVVSALLVYALFWLLQAYWARRANPPTR